MRDEIEPIFKSRENGVEYWGAWLANVGFAEAFPEVVSELQESGFYVSMAAVSAIVLEVSTSHDVFTRHHQRVMAQATVEADEAWAEDAPSGEAEHLSDEQVDAELTGYESVK